MHQQIFNFDWLAKIATVLILLISAIILAYCKTYLRGDRKKPAFLAKILLLGGSLIATCAANHIVLLGIFWLSSNLILVSLMIHKAKWQQAKSSGILALKNFAIGFIALASALALLKIETGSYLVSEIVKIEILQKEVLETPEKPRFFEEFLGSQICEKASPHRSRCSRENLDNDKIIEKDGFSEVSLMICGLLLLIAALSQSAIYPFSSWLISSLNSPTPASAMMHAGLVNGGGIILAKFAPLFFQMPEILTLAFILGMFSAIIGGVWKLLQSNIKAMLTCSTISQMGFMIAQCAMGLFPAAVAHLFWHGLFKSYLFLASPNVWRERRLDLNYPPKINSFVYALACGSIGAMIFMKINEIYLDNFDTSLFLAALCFIATSQIALTIADDSILKNFLSALIFSSAAAIAYSYSILLIKIIIPNQYFQPQPINFCHLLAIFILLAMWLIRLFWKAEKFANKPFFLRFYVKALNASQPKPQTITANRNNYKF